MSKGFTAQLNEILEDFYEVVRDGFEGAQKEVAEECVKKLKSVTWKTNTGKRYSATWTLKQDKSLGGTLPGYVVYNKKNGQLTHLLENGHLIVNAKGTFGRTAPHKHIEPVYEWAQGELEREIRQRIERGGR